MASSHTANPVPTVSKRRQIFQRRGFQLRFTILTAGALLVLLLFTSLHGLFVAQRVLSQDMFAAVWPELQSSTIRLLLVGLLYVCVVSLAAAFLSHRAVGPLGRLEEQIRKMNDSGTLDPLKIREGDDLEPVVQAINELIRKIKGTK